MVNATYLRAGDLNASLGSANADIQELLKYYDQKIYFTQNQGQFSSGVLYKAEFHLGQAIATKDGMIISTYDPTSVAARESEGIQLEEDIRNGMPWRPMSSILKGHTWKMDFVNRSSAMTIDNKDHHADVYNYFTGNTAITNVNNYGEIWYNNVYNQVDVRYYPSETGTLEYDIICKPGFKKENISIRFEGIDQMAVQENGHLVMHTSAGDVDFPSPVVYQKINGVQKPVTARYVVSNNNLLKFELGEFDASLPLIIDPIALRWATWVNTASTGDNHGHCIWVDQNEKSIYMVARVVGTTDQMTPGTWAAAGNLEMIIGKYKEPDAVGGTGTRVWQTYVGGGGDDNPYAMEQGPDGNLYITGYTASTNFPLLLGSAFSGSSINQGNQATDNIFITKIDPSGTSLKSSVIGGNGDDGGFDLRINEAGDILICGNVASSNLGTLYSGTGASNTVNGIDVVVFKINQDLSTISWMKNYGGTGTDQATIMLQNVSNGDIYVAGYTTSSNFPTLLPRQGTIGGSQSGFIQKLTASGNFAWSSYFQSANSKSTSILCMEFNTLQTQLYFGGITTGLASTNISASGTFDNSYNGGSNDFFVCRMDTDQNFVASTYLGGGANEVNMMGLNTDLNNDVYIFGYTNSTDFPMSAFPNTPLQSSNQGNNDKTFSKLNSTLSTLNFSTYYGGTGDDYDPVGERGIKFSNCRIYTIVTSKSNNIPLTQGALNTSRTGSVYEPGMVIWANPPDLLGNTITGNQTICAGTVPGDLTGSEPAYVLPTILRGPNSSAYPSIGSATTYQWQISTDSTNWTDISGANAQNLPGTTIGALYQKTFFRRIIGGDACILAGAADQVVTVRIVTVTADVSNVSCNGAADGSITANSDGVAPFTYDWSTGEHTQTISGLAPGTYSVTVTDNGNCTASNSFTISEPAVVDADAGADKEFLCVAGSVVLNGSSSIVNAQFAWTSPDGNISQNANTANPTVNAVGMYVLTVTNPANGCIGRDTAYVTLTTQNSSSTANIEICDGQSYTPPGGTAQTTGGTYVTHIPNNAGCDSTITTHLTVNPVFSTGETHAICQGGSYSLPWGGSATSGGDYTHTYPSRAGCDSLVTIHIDVNQTYSTSESHAICQGGSYSLPWGGTATTGGDYTHTYSSVAGCDSLVTIHIDVNQTYSTSESHAICVGGSYSLPWGGTATTGGDYTHTYSSVAGCDSLVTIHIDVNQTYSTSESHAICQGGSYSLPWGGTATTGGDYTHTYSSQAGCDSLVTIHIDVNQTYSTSETHAICQGGSYSLPWGGSATTGGDYTHTYPSQVGCDSLVTIHIDVNQTYSTSETHAICQGGSYSLPWGGSATSGGDYTHTYPSLAGCDSLVTIHIDVNQTYSTSETHAICQGGSYSLPWGGSATSGGDYTHTYPSQVGCDSLVTIHIDVNQTYSTSETHAICQGGSYSLPWGGSATTGGDYTHTYSSVAGCDSLVTIHIDLNPVPHTDQNASICQGGTFNFPWGGSTTQAGNYSHTYQTNAGCDSVATIHLSVSPAYHTSSNASICQGSSYTLPWGQVVNSSGTYTHTYTTAQQCDSIVSVVVTCSPGPSCNITTTGCGNNNSICQGQTVRLCAPTGNGYTYTWSTGEHTSCINVTTAGTYTVTVSNGSGCSSTCSKIITVNPGPSCAISVSGCGNNNTICQGRAAQLCGPSGFGYSYTWSNGMHSQCISVSTSGTYTLTVTNSSGCSSTCTKTITVSQSPSCNITVTGCGSNNTICQGQMVELCAPAGQGYTYTWSNGMHTRCISVNSGGTYSVTVTNAAGCSSTCSKTIYSSPAPSCSITVSGCGANNSICQGQSVTLCAPAGNGYSYTWSNGMHSRCITVNTGGTYSVTVSNANGCSSTCSKTIIQSPTPSSTITAGTTSLCSGQSTTLCVNGGTGYSYTWSNGSHNRCITINCPGTYSVTVTNSNGCSSTSSICITSGHAPSSNISGSLCFNQGSSTTLCAPAGTNYSYTWSNGSHSRCINVSCAGSYSVTVSNGCGTRSSCVYVSKCRSHCNWRLNPSGKTLTVEPQEGNGPYSFDWINEPSQTTSTINVNNPGLYEVTITDRNGNKTTESYFVTLPSLIVTAYPNPFHSETTIEFTNSGNTKTGSIEIYSLEGRKVAVLYEGEMENEKTYLVKWDARENEDGIYIYKIICGDAVQTGRLTLMKE